jgi:hypothetical protein
MNQPTPTPQCLQFYWYETDPNTKTAEYWGQLVGSTHRLRFITEQLESLHNEQDLNTVLNYLEYHIENYLIRIYELRERLFSLVTAITGDEKTVNKLRHLDKRSDALIALRAKDEKIIQLLEQLLISLDEDVQLRNFHTHNIFLKLGFWDDYDIYDPHDILVDMQSDPETKSRFEINLWQAIRRAIECYQTKIDKIIQVAITLLKEAENNISFN